jgi:hypothetical protein
MFKFETLADTYAKNTKAALAYVQPDAVKTALVELTDRQVDFAKSMVKQAETASEYFVKYSKEFTEKFFLVK